MEPKQVNDFHKFSDVDNSKLAQHHTLGSGPNQSSPGNHNHDGTTSTQSIAPLGDIVFTGSRNTDAWRQQVMAVMVLLGATDSTVA